VEKIRAGNSNIRNPILISYIAKGLLPYKGLGSGIKRALEEWPQIEFTDDREGCLFTATVHRSSVESSKTTPDGVKSSVKSSVKILELFENSRDMTIIELADQLGISTRVVEKQINKLKEKGRLHRVGPAKGGHWEVLK